MMWWTILKGFLHIFEQCDIPFILVSTYAIKLSKPKTVINKYLSQTSIIRF